jgi:hypothetical protein
MKVVLNSYDLLRAIGAHRDAFSAIEELVRKQATALLTAQLKHKSLDIKRYRMVCEAVGTETFELFMDSIDDKLLKGIAKKIDPLSLLVKAANIDQLRSHLLLLAQGKVQPTAKAPKSAGKGAVAKHSKAKSASGGPHAIVTKPPGRG